MATGGFSQNVSKLFTELKLVTDNLSLYEGQTLGNTREQFEFTITMHAKTIALRVRFIKYPPSQMLLHRIMYS